MDVPLPYLINDTRKPELFRKTTFSGYLKKDVFNTLFKKIDEGKIPEVCLWSTECICSGYIDELWDRIIIYYSKFININSPFLPTHFIKNLVMFLRLKEDEHFKKHILDLRNSQEIRNHFCELFCIITNATKSRKSLTIPKIIPKDFIKDNFKKRLKAKDLNKVKSILLEEDPQEIIIMSNELANSISEYNYNINDSIYWISWILEWEKIAVLKKGKYECGYREIGREIDKKYKRDFIWLIWIIIFKEMQFRKMDMLEKEIKSLFELFKFQFTPSKKKRRIFLIFTAIQMLSPEFHFNQDMKNKYPIFEKYYYTLQASANINVLYKELKQDENLENDYVNSKIKQNATFVKTTFEEISSLESISQKRQYEKELKKKNKEYKKYLLEKQKQKKINKEERNTLKKGLIEHIDNMIINTSHLRPKQVRFKEPLIVDRKEVLEEKNKNKTVSIIENIDKKLGEDYNRKIKMDKLDVININKLN